MLSTYNLSVIRIWFCMLMKIEFVWYHTVFYYVEMLNYEENCFYRLQSTQYLTAPAVFSGGENFFVAARVDKCSEKSGSEKGEGTKRKQKRGGRPERGVRRGTHSPRASGQCESESAAGNGR